MPLCSGVIKVVNVINSNKNRQVEVRGGLDPNFANVALLLHMEGIDNGTTFTDSSSNARTINVINNAKTKTDNFKFGLSSLYLTGDNSRLDVTGISVASGQDCCFECFIRPSTFFAGPAIFGDSTMSFQLLSIQSNDVYTSWGGTELETTSNPITLDTWQHVAVTRASGTMRIFVDGVKHAERSGDTTTLSPQFIGYNGISGRYAGWIDEVRWTIGAARYASNFTPPSAQFPDS